MTAVTTDVSEIDVGPIVDRFLNRELSWLDFNSRVLAQAEDAHVPLLERLKFCAIYGSNLDEFFMVRVAGLADQVAAGITSAPPDGLSPLTQLAEIRTKVEAQVERLEAVQVEELFPLLHKEGIEILGWDELDADDRATVAQEFHDRVFPVLTPLAVDPGHPFPYISNLSLNVAVLVTEPETDHHRFARIKVPPSLPRFLALPGEHRYVPLEAVIIAHLDKLFPGMQLIGGWPFRVTRNADLTLDSDADDLLEAVEMELRRRRFGQAIRLEVTEDIPPEAYGLLLRELDIDEDAVYRCHTLLDPTGYWQLVSIDRADLQVEGTPGITPARLRDLEDGRDLFSRIRRGDMLVQHPYDSFNASVTEFIRKAALDPKVLAIKITLYRTSGDSPIIDALIDAAERGKQVAALVELKARFDEENNIVWARRLEEAGVHVAYGLMGLKIHTKITLVVRDEKDGVRRYCHVGTGNYNPKTAKIYEDVGILTADPVVGADVTHLFNALTGYGRSVDYGKLLVAPTGIRSSFEQLIRAEMQAPPGAGHIVLKMNSLVDAGIIGLLYEASRAGVQIDLIVRGICCLLPGVPGLSDNIRVRSIVGRYLEHSRLYYFAHGALADFELDRPPVTNADGRPDRFYIGSADLMPRNLDRRVEALVRVDDLENQRRLSEILVTCLDDTELAWEMQPDGHYVRIRDRFEDRCRSRIAGVLAEVHGISVGRERVVESAVGGDGGDPGGDDPSATVDQGHGASSSDGGSSTLRVNTHDELERLARLRAEAVEKPKLTRATPKRARFSPRWLFRS